MLLAISENVLRVPGPERLGRARELGVDGLELHLGSWEIEQHPLLRPGGAAELRQQAEAVSLRFPLAYAGCFLEQPLHAAEGDIRRQRQLLLDRLLAGCVAAGVGALVLPLYGAAEPRDDTAFHALAEVLKRGLEQTAGQEVELVLLAPWGVDRVRKLADAVDGRVKVGYDVGIATQLDYDLIADLRWLGAGLGPVRLRDRTRDGRWVALGQGRVDVAGAVRTLKERRYAGWLVVGVPDEQDLQMAARRELDYVRGLLRE